MTAFKDCARFALATGLTLAAVSEPVSAGLKPRASSNGCPCEQRILPPVESSPVAPADPSRSAPVDIDQPSNDLASDAFGSAANPQSIAPNMMGDLFGLGGAYFLGFTNGQGQRVSAENLTPVNGGRRLKIGESVSPMPRDRIFFLYNMFRGPYRTQAPAGGVNPLGTTDTDQLGVPPGPAGAGSKNFDLNRFTVGVEKTFFNNWASVELRVPVGYTLDSRIRVTDSGAIPGYYSVEMDNIPVTLKSLLTRTDRLALSTGIVINTPTADGINVQQSFTNVAGGATIGHTARIANQSVHAAPFLGYLLTPTDRSFVQGFFQYDFGLNGNRVTFIPVTSGVMGPVQTGNLNDQSLFQADIAAGYWVYRNETAEYLRGFAPIMEIHYTSTTDNADLLTFTNPAGAYRSIVGNTLNRLDIINMTVGSTFQIGERSTVATTFVVPLNRGDHNFLFNWEFGLQFNYRFGAALGPQSPVYNQ